MTGILGAIKRRLRYFLEPKPQRTPPIIIPRSEHSISRAHISKSALKVLYRLKEKGYSAYLVGGGVRDLLLGQRPKDFDVVTNARPEEIRRLFRNSQLIGRRFRLVHVLFGHEVIEVATFRTQEVGFSQHHVQNHEGMIVRDNVYGNIEDDAWRRDCSINALYYNIADFSVEDYTGGMADLRQGIVRIIGNPTKRYQEDPIRIVRVIRLAARFNFTIEAMTEQPILQLSGLLQNVPPARLYIEIMKLFCDGHAQASFALLRRYELYSLLFPQSEACLHGPGAELSDSLLMNAFYNMDQRFIHHKPVSPAFLFAVLLWHPLQETLKKHQQAKMPLLAALDHAMDGVLKNQLMYIAVPRRLTDLVREIWVLQYRLPRRHQGEALRLLGHPQFRAAYDFLLLRAKSGEEVYGLASWWTTFQAADELGRSEMLKKIKDLKSKPKRRSSKKD